MTAIGENLTPVCSTSLFGIYMTGVARSLYTRIIAGECIFLDDESMDAQKGRGWECVLSRYPLSVQPSSVMCLFPSRPGRVGSARLLVRL